MDPFIVGNIVSAAGSLVGGAMSSRAQRKANEQNAQLAREQWQREQQYNDPSAQAIRLRKAGLNPAMYMQNIPATQGSVSQMSPEDGMSQGLQHAFGSAGSAIANYQAHQQQIERGRLENYQLGVSAEFAKAREIRELEKKLSEIQLNDSAKYKNYSQIKDIEERLEEYKVERKELSAINGKTLELLGEQINEQKHATLRLDNESAQRIASMKVSSAVEWFNARTQRDIAQSQIKINAKQEDLLDDALNLARKTHQFKVSQEKFKALLGEASADQQKILAKIAYLQLGNVSEQAQSAFASFVRETFGLDVTNLFGGAGTAALKAITR